MLVDLRLGAPEAPRVRYLGALSLLRFASEAQSSSCRLCRIGPHAGKLSDSPTHMQGQENFVSSLIVENWGHYMAYEDSLPTY